MVMGGYWDENGEVVKYFPYTVLWPAHVKPFSGRTDKYNQRNRDGFMGAMFFLCW
jgi:hypothetical protein